MKPVRVQLKRTKGWRMPANTVKVDRNTEWGNPYTIGSTINDPLTGKLRPAENVDDVLAAYREMVSHWARNYEDENYSPLDRARNLLRGKNLACWCPLDAPCHADVLLELANTQEPTQ